MPRFRAWSGSASCSSSASSAYSRRRHKAHQRRRFRDAGRNFPELARWAEEWRLRIVHLYQLHRARRQTRAGSPDGLAADAALRAHVQQIREDMERELRRSSLHPAQRRALEPVPMPAVVAPAQATACGLASPRPSLETRPGPRSSGWRPPLAGGRRRRPSCRAVTPTALRPHRPGARSAADRAYACPRRCFHNRRTHRLPPRWIFIRPLRPDYRAVLRAPLPPPPSP